MHSSASNLPVVSHCFYNKAQIPQDILPGSAWSGPCNLQPFSPTTPRLVLPYISLHPVPPACFLSTDVSGSFPLRPFACAVSSPAFHQLAISHYSPFRPQLECLFWGNLSLLQTLALLPSFYAFIVSLSEHLSFRWTPFFKRQTGNGSGFFTYLFKAKNDVGPIAGTHWISVGRK